MTVPSDAVPHESPPAVSPPAPAAVSMSGRPFYWSVRRELWENRALYVAPLIAAAVVLFAFSLGALHLARHRHAMLSFDSTHEALAITLPFEFAALAILVTGVIVGAFYCLGALHNERRDRSILFWKSLPVSDLATVLSKAIIPLVVLPVILFVVILAMQLVMLALGTATLLARGSDVAAIWTHLPFVQMQLVSVYGLAAVALWYAPILGWLLLVSGWARRAPFLWAVLPPLALCVIEKIAFDTGNLASLLKYRLAAFDQAFTVQAHEGIPASALPQIDPVGFVSSPGLWAGLVFAGACIAAAIWLRRYRDPI